jgi:FkbM family methyltransferase
LSACASWLGWQVGSRTLGRRRFNWVDGLKVAAQPGLHGVTANVGLGLAEPEVMGFLLHYLRPGDLVLDVGANAGSYTLLAASRGAKVIAFEPNPLPRAFLQRSLALNGLAAEVVAAAVSDRAGTLAMDLSGDATGHVSAEGSDTARSVTLDGLASPAPALVKIDVEGHEAAVIAGGRKTLSTTDSAIVETWGAAPLHEQLALLGLRPFAYDPASRRLTPREEFTGAQSVLFVRDAVAAATRLAAGPRFRLGRRTY